MIIDIERFEIPSIGTYAIQKRDDKIEVCAGGSYVGGTLPSVAKARQYILGHAQSQLTFRREKLQSELSIIESSIKELSSNDVFDLAQYRTKKS